MSCLRIKGGVYWFSPLWLTACLALHYCVWINERDQFHLCTNESTLRTANGLIYGHYRNTAGIRSGLRSGVQSGIWPGMPQWQGSVGSSDVGVEKWNTTKQGSFRVHQWYPAHGRAIMWKTKSVCLRLGWEESLYQRTLHAACSKRPGLWLGHRPLSGQPCKVSVRSVICIHMSFAFWDFIRHWYLCTDTWTEQAAARITSCWYRVRVLWSYGGI